ALDAATIAWHHRPGVCLNQACGGRRGRASPRLPWCAGDINMRAPCHPRGEAHTVFFFVVGSPPFFFFRFYHGAGPLRQITTEQTQDAIGTRPSLAPRERVAEREARNQVRVSGSF